MIGQDLILASTGETYEYMVLTWTGMGKARHAGPGGMGELRQSVKVGKLNLVDLAGSERVHITGATGHPPSSLPPSYLLACIAMRAHDVRLRCEERLFVQVSVH